MKLFLALCTVACAVCVVLGLGAALLLMLFGTDHFSIALGGLTAGSAVTTLLIQLWIALSNKRREPPKRGPRTLEGGDQFPIEYV